MNSAERPPRGGDVRVDVSSDPPVSELFAEVVGQVEAVRQLRSAVRRPVHAYLLVGPPGLSQQPLVRGFAAALLCLRGGCGRCDVCRRALSGVHPDLVEVERAGASVTVEDARRVVRLAQRRPFEGHRQVIVVGDVHLARLAAPVLLKTLEEPAEQSVFVLLADLVPAELATVASRCVRIDLVPLAPQEIEARLVSEGVEEGLAAEVAQASGGSAERARLLVQDPGLAKRLDLWRSVPSRLDGTGSSAATLAVELLTSCEDALEPLRARHAAERRALDEQTEAPGPRTATARRQFEEHQHREERRWRTDELRAGLAVLAAAYRDRLTEAARSSRTTGPHGEERMRGLGAAIDAVEDLVAEMVRNPNETLMLQALLVRLSAVPA